MIVCLECSTFILADLEDIGFTTASFTLFLKPLRQVEFPRIDLLFVTSSLLSSVLSASTVQCFAVVTAR